MNGRIAILEEDANLSGLFHEMLELEGYEPVVLPLTPEVLTRLQECEPDALILDIRLKPWDARWALLKQIRNHETLRNTPVVLSTADPDRRQNHRPAPSRATCQMLFMPFGLKELSGVIKACLAGGWRDSAAVAV